MFARRVLVIATAVVVALVAVGLAAFLATRPRSEDDKPAMVSSPELVARGGYLVRAGSCRACHTLPDGTPFAGGRGIPTPFGTIYTTNLTPDPDTGLGAWSADDFWRALHEGVSRDGSLLYPAFPYPNYTRVRREDSDAIFAWLRTLPAVRSPAKPPEMRFPYDKRALLAGWRALYFRAATYQDDKKQSAQWNRGAYLVQGLGHCSACHAARNMWGAVTADPQTAGGLIPILNWYAPSLTSSRETGLGDWEIGDVVDLLKTGVSKRGAVFGPMAEVARESLQHLTPEDITAMAVYLKSQAEEEGADDASAYSVSRERRTQLMAAGERIYRDRCADCHKADGRGVERAYPPLVDNEAILMRNPVNAIRMTLNGGFPPSTQGNPRPYGMPPYAHLLNDDEVAAVVTYIRGAWGNHAEAVSPLEVAGVRGVPLVD